jgi:hypothetical protein
MSYFTSKNTSEHGPGPTAEIEWLVVQDPKDINGSTKCAMVRAKTAYYALREAEKYIEDFSGQNCVCYPNPRLYLRSK